jgi:hypothetical protein
MRIACWITKATDTHCEYEILIAFSRQQWLGEDVSMLRSYVHCLSCFNLSVLFLTCPSHLVKRTNIYGDEICGLYLH